MDPIAAVGLASGILTFIDAGTKLIKTAYAIHNSLDGVLEDNRHREDITGTVEDAASRLEITGILALTKEQQSLTDLAKRCQAISKKLIQLLDKIKPKGTSFKALKSLRHAVKANKSKTPIQDLERQLKDYRDQLSLALIEISRVEAADGFSQLIFIAKNNEAKLKSLIQAVEHLRQGQLSEQASLPQQLQQLLVVDTTARHSMYQDFILDCLKCQELHHRYEAVHSAHEDTFSWIYEPIEFTEGDDPFEVFQSQPLNREVEINTTEPLNDWWSYCREKECLKMQLQSQERFLRWLSSEVPLSPIFHISGKLGSGKSTLMKFICSNQKTTDELSKWAGGRKLAFTSFFFWRNGSTAQKSLDGLCRSILHCVLDERRDLIAKVFPIRWEEAEQSPWKIQNRREIPSREVQYALEKLLQDTRLYQHHKFCIFIDGLDEFEPGLEDGLAYVDLVDILRRWTSNASGNLKLCLSSREEPVFVEGFADAPGFRLQDLTRFDMQNYVRSRLSNLTDDDLKDEMTSEIQKRSSGIFLWTYLVVKSIRNKIAHRATRETLRKYLETLPQGLESLFHHILRQLEPDDKRKTLQLISCIQAANSFRLDLPLIAFSLLDNYSRDSTFSLRDGLEDEMLPDDWVLQAQLRGASGGLIECGSGEGNQNVMEFVHRSVPDMFHNDARNPALSREMEMALHGINCIDLISHLCFAAVRLSISDSEFQDNQNMFREIGQNVCVRIAYARLTHGIDKPPYQFLEHIESWIETDRLGQDSEVLLNIHEPHIYYIETVGGADVEKCFNLPCLAVLGDGGYIDWKIRNDPSTLNDSVKRAMAGQSLLMSDNWEIFFRYSISTSDTATPLLPHVRQYYGVRPADDKWPLTVWQLFLINVILTRSSSPEGPADVMSRFLKEGADPYCRILITKAGGYRTVTFCFRQARCHQCHLFEDGLVGFKDGFNRCLALRGTAEIDWHKDPDENISPQEISLREWVAATNWNNRESLLELLDCSCKEDRDI